MAVEFRDASDVSEWSPDGTRLAFEMGQPLSYEVMAMKAAPEGRTNRPVNLSKSPADDGRPAWSPDAKKVAFQSNREAPDGTTDYDVWRVRATDGANPTNLTDNAAAIDFDPEWQPVPWGNTPGNAGRTGRPRPSKEAPPSAGPSLWPRPAG